MINFASPAAPAKKNCVTNYWYFVHSCYIPPFCSEMLPTQGIPRLSKFYTPRTFGTYVLLESPTAFLSSTALLCCLDLFGPPHPTICTVRIRYAMKTPTRPEPTSADNKDLMHLSTCHSSLLSTVDRFRNVKFFMWDNYGQLHPRSVQANSQNMWFALDE